MNAEDVLMLIHPPLAIVCYLFVIINAVHTFTNGKRKHQEITILLAWFLCLGGLITGMIWAEIAWGNYWNWDPKEIGMLLLFLSISGYLIIFNEFPAKRKPLLLFTITNLISMIATLFVSPALDSLHSHYYILGM